MFGTGSRLQVARIGGIPIYISYSWFAIAGLFAFWIYGILKPHVPSDELTTLTALTLVLFFTGILLHEGAHAVSARSFGLPVRAITLVFWGGATETRSWRKGALADFVVAGSGPATTAVLGVVFLFIAASQPPYSGLRYAMEYLGGINLFFAVFNAIPGFPLDGGRMLMAVAWGITRKRVLALRVAGIASLVIGGAFMFAAVLLFGKGNGSAIFLGYIGFVMLTAGRQIPSRAALRERLQRGTARDAMRSIADPIPADIPLYDATERWLRSRPETVFPVAAAGKLVGTISWEDATRHRGVHAGGRGDDPARRSTPGRGRRTAGRRRGVDRRPRRARGGRSETADRPDRRRGRRRLAEGPLVNGRVPGAGARDPAPARPLVAAGVSAPRGSIRVMAAPSLRFDDAQETVLAHRDGPMLATGAAGTGKTAILQERFARLIEDGAEPERVALVLGTRRARDTARSAMLERLPESLPGLQILTSHGLAHRVLKLRDVEPPEVLGAAEQFAMVRELLVGQDPAAWPAYGALLQIRGFADEVRQLLTRMQESLLSPADLERDAADAGLGGWAELARFAQEYLDALDSVNHIDYAGLVQRAAVEAGPGLFDHVLVDDYQDTTLAAEALLRTLKAESVVVAADPDAHVFSFQGMTRVPLDRFTTDAFPDAAHVHLSTAYRCPAGPTVQAWVAPHSSEEHASIARELRRIHVEEGVGWGDLAVIVRRQGAHLGNLLRALDDARIPRAVPERGKSLTLESATYPYVLALRWLVADAARRDELIEPLLTSDVVGLSPAAARGLIRLATSTGPTPRAAAAALDRTDGLAPEEALRVERARATLDKAALFAGMSVQDAFKVLWEELPCSARLVAAGGQELDTAVTFADVVADASEQGDAGVQAFLEALDAGEHGPGWSAREVATADAVQVLTAHGASGLEFDTVLVAGTTEGNFPSLSRPEPMFDLAALHRVRSRSEQIRERLEDERRLFQMVLGRARRGVTLIAADTHADADELTLRSRFVDELPGVVWAAAPEGGLDEPVSVGEAVAAWRRQLADPSADAWRRLAALDGLRALGVDASHWWFQRDWTDTGLPLHEDLRVSFSRLSSLENCELQHVLGDELGLGRVAGYQAWVGKLVHGIIERVEKGEVGKTKEEILAEVDRRWRDEEFPSKAVSSAHRQIVETKMFKNWWFEYGEEDSLANEAFFSFEFDDATIVGVIDRIGPFGDGTRITDFKTGSADYAPKAEESLQLGIYYLAVQECEELEPYRPVRQVELAYIKGDWKRGELVRPAWQVTPGEEEDYQTRVRAELSRLIAKKRELIATETYRPSPTADCFWCDFKPLCPLFPEGQPVFDLTRAP